jgi:hypothetical protein
VDPWIFTKPVLLRIYFETRVSGRPVCTDNYLKSRCRLDKGGADHSSSEYRGAGLVR